MPGFPRFLSDPLIFLSPGVSRGGVKGFLLEARLGAWLAPAEEGDGTAGPPACPPCPAEGGPAVGPMQLSGDTPVLED